MREHTVLVVEDDLEIRESLVDVLEGSGYRVIAASNGREALRTLAMLETAPCLILLDLMMPIMDGRSFRAEQMRMPGLAEVPVVIVSAYRDVLETATALQAHDFLPKPFDVEDLMGVTRRYCPGGEESC